jgi:two-component system sensor histidine kinase TctE
VRRSVSQEKRFLNDAAHQLRTPLAGLKSQTELALHETDPAALQQRLAKVHAGAERSAHLVHQLLHLARSEADIQRKPLDCAALARDLAKEVAPRALSADVDFGYEGDDSLMVEGEQLLLREALSNLLDNALRYAPVPGRPCQITLSARREVDLGETASQRGGRAAAVLEVQDNGPGLDESARSHVFERFWRGSDLPGGCGLGLAIVKEIAERHGGVARVLPNAPQGLRVQLVLPLAGSGG